MIPKNRTAAGQWVRGQSGNPLGRPPTVRRDAAEVGMARLAMARQGTTTRRDMWENAASGHGSNRDRRVLTRFGADVVTDLEALVLWRSEPLAARIIEAWVEAAYRRSWSIKCEDADLAQKMRKWATDLKVEAAIRTCAHYKEAYGGGAIFPALDGALGDLSEPLNLDSIINVKALHVLEPRELQPVDYYNDLNEPGFRTPMIWRVMPLSSGRSGYTPIQYVHASRLIIMQGNKVSMQTQPGQREGWGDSALCRPNGVIADFGLAWGSAATLLHQHGRATIAKDGLVTMLGMADGLQQFNDWMTAMQMCWSSLRMNVVDAKDQITYSTGTLSGLADMLREFKSMFSAATEGIPLSVLFGESQTGLRTGDSDLESWDAKVEGKRNDEYKPPHEQILRLMWRSSEGPSKGEEPEVWSLEYPPLSAPTPSELATIRKTNMERAEVGIGNGVFSADDVADSWYGAAPDGDIKGDIHINWERREQQAQIDQTTPDQMSPEDMSAMGYEPDDDELDQMAADDEAMGNGGMDEDPSSDQLDDLEAQDDEEGADLEWDDANPDDEDRKDDQRSDQVFTDVHKVGDGKGYNPYRSHGKFAPGPRAQRAKTGGPEHAAGAAVKAGANAGGQAKPRTARVARPKFDDSAHKAKIAEHKTTELHHRQESIRIAGEMRGLKEQAKSLPRGKAGQAQRAELKAQHSELTKQRDAHRTIATEARTSRVATSKELQSARKEHMAAQRAGKTEGAKPAAPAPAPKPASATPANQAQPKPAAQPKPKEPVATAPPKDAYRPADHQVAGAKPMTDAALDQARAKFSRTTTPEEFQAVGDYRGSYFGTINRTLRGSATERDLRESNLVSHDVKLLDSALSKNRLESPVVTYRGSEPHPIFEHLKPGEMFVEKGYMSTSTDIGSTMGGAYRFHITWPTGSKLAGITADETGHTGAWGFEKEMVGGRGTALRLDKRETGMHPDGYQQTILHFTAVGQE